MNDRGKRILFVSSSLSYGGAEKMLCFIANELAEHNYDVTVINLLEHPDDAGRLNKRIKIIELDVIKIRYLDRIHQILKLIRIIRREKPYVIISFKFKPNYLSVIAGKILHIPVIISERCDPSREYVLSGRVKIYWDIINSATGGVFQTEGARGYYSEGMQKRGIVIPNPVILKENISHTVRSGQESGVIISVGRLSNVQKRYDIMLAAFRQFVEKNSHYILKIYGDGEDEERIKQWAVDNHIENNVLFKGRTDHPLQVMDQADIFISTSDYEGISNSLIEAMAIGMPVIATDCTPGGARLLIKHEDNGLLVPCGDIEMISAAMNRMANDDQLRQKCGEQAKKIRTLYNPQKIVDQWIKYIDTVIAAFYGKV